MYLRKLLKESAKELRERPSFFIPKVTVSLIGSAWMLGIIYLIGDPMTASESQTQALLLALSFFPVMAFLGILSPVVVAEMVKNNGKLIESLKTCLGYTPRLIVASILMIFAIVAVTIPAYIGLIGFILFNSIPALIIGLTTSIAALVLMTYGIYFLPITLTENSAIESVKESFKASKENKREVSLLLVFSFTLLILAAFSSGAAQKLGAAGFVLGRVISAVVSTYTVIISPKMYLDLD